MCVCVFVCVRARGVWRCIILRHQVIVVIKFVLWPLTNVGSQYESIYMSHFWNLGFSGGP